MPDILAQIGENALAADAPAPTERELATVGVSRPIVREALRRLREEGLIYSRQGAGSFVAGDAKAPCRASPGHRAPRPPPYLHRA